MMYKDNLKSINDENESKLRKQISDYLYLTCLKTVISNAISKIIKFIIYS